MTRPFATLSDSRSSLTPKLRFPEFGGQAWREALLQDVTAECTSRNGEKLPIESIMGVTKAEGIVPMEERLIGADISRYKIIQKDCFAYNPMRLNIGSIARWKSDSDALVSPDYVVFRCLKKEPHALDPGFLDQFRRSDQWKDFVTESGLGSVRVRIYYKDLGRLCLTIPSLLEQQKIAECLDTLDELIGAESQKLDALKAHKKGLMQQLFPREGETLPRLRFPEFHSAPEWEAHGLGPKTIKVGSGITPTGGDKNYKREGRLFMRSQNVGWGVLLLDDVAFIDEETHRSFDSTEIKTSDVLLNITGASIGRSAVADTRLAGGNVNQHVCIIRVKPEELNPIFLNQFLLSQYGQKQIDSFQAGGNRQGLNFAQIRSFSVPLPPSPAEQHRIATCLSSLDELIAAQCDRLSALHAHKQGLLQQLFPSRADSDA